jgi:hypothetical protein
MIDEKNIKKAGDFAKKEEVRKKSTCGGGPYE